MKNPKWFYVSKRDKIVASKNLLNQFVSSSNNCFVLFTRADARTHARTHAEGERTAERKRTAKCERTAKRKRTAERERNAQRGHKSELNFWPKTSTDKDLLTTTPMMFNIVT
jgi:hypothetical protein